MASEHHDVIESSGPRVEPEDPETVQAILEDAPEAALANQRRAEAILGELDADDVPEKYSNEGEWGFTFTGILAHHPEVFKLWWAEEGQAFGDGNLDRGFKELVAAVIAHRRGAEICIAWHTTSAKLEEIDPEYYGIAADFDGRKGELDEAERAAVELAVKSVEGPASVTDADIERVKSHGYSDADLVELVTTAGTAAKFANYSLTFDI